MSLKYEILRLLSQRDEEADVNISRRPLSLNTSLAESKFLKNPRKIRCTEKQLTRKGMRTAWTVAGSVSKLGRRKEGTFSKDSFFCPSSVLPSLESLDLFPIRKLVCPIVEW